jgi:hypothetical protein
VSPLDLLAAGAEAKHTAALLREARAVLRRVDALAVQAVDDPAAALIAEARTSMERCIVQLAHREQAQQRRLREAVRRQR